MVSVWTDTSTLPEFESLKKDIKTDVLIIGGGIAGILCAYMLAENGIDYTLVEAERICGGVTNCTTAKITSQHGLIYNKLIHEYGAEKAKMYLDANEAALKKYRSLCRSIDCDFESKDSYVYSTDDYTKISKELKALEKIGCDAEFADRLPLPLSVEGAVRFKKQAQFNPLKFISAISKNLNIYESTCVRQLIGNTAVTGKNKIRAKKIIVATHFPFINKHGSYFLKLYQHRSYVIALENAAQVDGIYVDESKSGMTFRNYKNYLLVGGGAHRTGKQGGCWQELKSFTQLYYPAAEEKYRWATQDCMTLDGIPYIGHYSAQTPDLYVAAGFNKWGMTSSMVAAMLLTDMIAGRKNPYAQVFSPSRTILHPQLAVNSFEAVTNLLAFSSKRCPHMGCSLKWNPYEHTWDCPCHGSRFTEDGKLINNPATGNINSASLQ